MQMNLDLEEHIDVDNIVEADENNWRIYADAEEKQ
jgi:hypothetical protein